MICDICHTRPATIKFTQVINLKKKEVNICEECAEKKGISNPLLGFQKLFGSILSLSQIEETEDTFQERDVLNLRCNSCNTTWKDFQTDGLLGCKDCYSTFNEKLKVLLRRIHGSNKHIGTRPSNHRIVVKEMNINELKNELKIAIKREEFEKAAELRDRIKDIEANLNRMQK